MPSSRLHLLTPPRLVQVRDVDGVLRPALLVARRADRCYLQVSRRAGDNVLRWLPRSALQGHGNPGDAAQLGT